METIIFTLVALVSVGFSATLAAGIIVYIRRTLQLMAREKDETPIDRLLDEVDRVQIQLEAANERLEKLERGMLDVRSALPSGESRESEPERGQPEAGS